MEEMKEKKKEKKNDRIVSKLFIFERDHIRRDKMLEHISCELRVIIFIVRNLSKHQITLNALYSHDISSTGSSIIPSSLYTCKPLSFNGKYLVNENYHERDVSTLFIRMRPFGRFEPVM